VTNPNWYGFPPRPDRHGPMGQPSAQIMGHKLFPLRFRWASRNRYPVLLTGPFGLPAIRPPTIGSPTFVCRRSVRMADAFGLSGLHDQMGSRSDRRGNLCRFDPQINRDYAEWVAPGHEIVTGVRHVIRCAPRPVDSVLCAGADLGLIIIRPAELRLTRSSLPGWFCHAPPFAEARFPRG